MPLIQINDLKIPCSLALQTLDQQQQLVIKGGNWRKRRARAIANCNFKKANRILQRHL